METILQGTAEIRFTHPDDFREWVRQQKRREMVEKRLTEQDVVVASETAPGEWRNRQTQGT